MKGYAVYLRTGIEDVHVGNFDSEKEADEAIAEEARIAGVSAFLFYVKITGLPGRPKPSYAVFWDDGEWRAEEVGNTSNFALAMHSPVLALQRLLEEE